MYHAHVLLVRYFHDTMRAKEKLRPNGIHMLMAYSNDVGWSEITAVDPNRHKLDII